MLWGHIWLSGEATIFYHIPYPKLYVVVTKDKIKKEERKLKKNHLLFTFLSVIPTQPVAFTWEPMVNKRRNHYFRYQRTVQSPFYNTLLSMWLFSINLIWESRGEARISITECQQNSIDGKNCLIILNWFKLPLIFLFWFLGCISCTLPLGNSFACRYFLCLAYHKLLWSTLGSRRCNNYICWQRHFVLPCRAEIVGKAKNNCMYLYVRLLRNNTLTRPLLLLFWGMGPRLVDESQKKNTRNSFFNSTVRFLLGTFDRNTFYNV